MTTDALEVEVTRAFTALHVLARWLYNEQRWSEGHFAVGLARQLCEHFDLEPGDDGTCTAGDS